jgi:hypothetical protein
MTDHELHSSPVGPHTLGQAFTLILDGVARTEAEYWREYDSSKREKWDNGEPLDWVLALNHYIEGASPIAGAGPVAKRTEIKAFLEKRQITAEQMRAEALEAAYQYDRWKQRLEILEEILTELCKAGKVTLEGRDASGQYVSVPANYFYLPVDFAFPYGNDFFKQAPTEKEWPDLKPLNNAEDKRKKDNRQPFFGVMIDVADVQTLKKAFRKQIEPNRVASEKEARGWLFSMVKSNPEALPDGKTKRDIREEALVKFPGLIPRGFDDRVWPEVVKLSRDLAPKPSSGEPIRHWGSPGRPKKS